MIFWGVFESEVAYEVWSIWQVSQIAPLVAEGDRSLDRAMQGASATREADDDLTLGSENGVVSCCFPKFQ